MIYGKKQLEDAGDTSYLISLKENYNDIEKQKKYILHLLIFIKIMVI